MSAPFVETAASAQQQQHYSPTAPPLSPRSRSRLLQFKLRSSCDACGQAKVKCDRGQPACARCVSQGLGCVYGVSRKAGKPPRKRPAGDVNTTVTTATFPSFCSVPSPHLGTPTSRFAGGPLPKESTEMATTAMTATSRDTSSMDMTVCGGISGVQGGHEGGDSDGMDMDLFLSMSNAEMGLALDDSPLSGSGFCPMESWFPLDASFGGGSSLCAFPPGSSTPGGDTCMSVSAGGQTTVASSSAMSLSPPTSISRTTSLSPGVLPAQQPPPPPTTSTPRTTTTMTTTEGLATAAPVEGHNGNCTQRTKEIMRRLYCANPFTPVSDGLPASRSLDLGSVLTRSGDIVGPLQTLLKCPCALSPHMAMLYSSILSRILLWYRQAAWSMSLGSSSREPSRDSEKAPPPTSLPTKDTKYPAGIKKNDTSNATTAVGSPHHASSDLLRNAGQEEKEDDDSNSASVLPVPVLVGTFQSEDRNLQAAMTSCLILNELKTVGGLIDMFTSLGGGAGGGGESRARNHDDGGARWGSTTTTTTTTTTITMDLDKKSASFYCATAREQLKGTGGRGGGGIITADPGLFASLGSWLRREHGVIVRKARAGLAVLDEDGV